MNHTRLAKIGYLGVGIVAGGDLVGTLTAQAATPAASPTASPSGGGRDGGHGGFALSLSGTVTAVGTSSVTIKTASGTTAYAVTSASDVDKQHTGVETKNRPAAPSGYTTG